MNRLIADIDAYSPKKDGLALWWLGQQSFVLKSGGAVVYIDPFLSPTKKRLVPPLLEPNEARHVDLVIGTHDHSDHIDRPAWPGLAEASPQARFLVPDFLLPRLAEDLKIPAGRFVGLNEDSVFERVHPENGERIRFTALASAHEFLDRDPLTGKYPYLGFVIETAGLVIYHPGDTCLYEGLVTKLSKWKFDLMLLPINGRSAKQLRSGIIGNMTYQEAVDLAGTLGCRNAVPTHYDMFSQNSGDPELFLEYLSAKFPKTKGHRLTPGRRFELTAGTAVAL